MTKPVHRENRKSKIILSLLRWYRKHGRELPWRNEKDPYRILVSEVMLQQTQVARVQAKYPEFLKKYPTFKKLASAGTSDVVRAWRGMGYNNRAIRLHALSQKVVREHGAKLPHRIEDLRKLPGIGRYTAHAIACFAFGQRVPVVDINVFRVMGRLYPVNNKETLHTPHIVWELASAHLPRSNAHDWNQAMMDLGSTICTAARPRCGSCPLKRYCPSAHAAPQKLLRRSRIEPGRNGIPNRIYRGKAIEVLRDLKAGASMNSASLARKVVTDFTPRDRPWFRSLLQSLERDGMVRLRGKTRISLSD